MRDWIHHCSDFRADSEVAKRTPDQSSLLPTLCISSRSTTLPPLISTCRIRTKWPFSRSWPRCKPNRRSRPRPSGRSSWGSRGGDEGARHPPRHLGLMNKPLARPAGVIPFVWGGGSPHPPAKHSRCPQESAERRGNCLELNPRFCLPRLRGQTPSNARRSHSPAPRATKSRCMSGYSAFLRLGQQMPRSSPGESPPNQPSRPLKPAAK
jgi:hypothetical protein